MLRAVRFAAKLNMRISPETAEPIPRLSLAKRHYPPARLFEESLKLLQAGNGFETYLTTANTTSSSRCFLSTITRYFTENGDSAMERIIAQVLKNTITASVTTRVNPAFLLCRHVSWYPLLEMAKIALRERLRPITTLSRWP